MNDNELKNYIFYSREQAEKISYDIINAITLREDCQRTDQCYYIDSDKITEKAQLSMNFAKTIVMFNDKMLVDFIRLAYLAGYKLELVEIENSDNPPLV